MSVISIKSDVLEVQIDLTGGTFYKIIDVKTGENLQYEGSENSWKDRDMVLFPFIGGVPTESYSLGGVTYPMSRHGFCRHTPFELVEKSDSRAVIRLIQTENMAKMYPNNYDFRLEYTVEGDKVSLNYTVDNNGDSVMYFYVGGHLAFAIDGTDEQWGEDTKGNFITLDKPTASYYRLGEVFITAHEPLNISSFEVDKQFMQKYRTLILDSEGERKLTLIRRNGRVIEYYYNSPVIAFWAMETTGKYVCIEPWWGISGFEDNQPDITKKKFINELQAGESFTCGYHFIVK